MSFDTILTTSEHAASMGGTQVYLNVGEKITVDEALKCVAIASANDCAVLLSEFISGTEQEFVNQMNKKAKDLGANNTNFTDCTGLNDENHYTTSYDLALISRHLIMNYPKVLDYTNLREDYIRKDTSSPFWLVNTNKLIGNLEEIKGLKTGHTSFAGYCITLYMKKENISLISVVFGYDTAAKRNAESLELLRYGSNNYKLNCILKKGTILEEINHILYKDRISLIINEDISIVRKKNNMDKYTYDYQFDLKANNGKLLIINNNEIIIEKDIILDKMAKNTFIELVLSLFKVVIG
jgi:D-alanyl-D-alanine carboxypeptidase (penicillin-binding protein 5/6)